MHDVDRTSEPRASAARARASATSGLLEPDVRVAEENLPVEVLDLDGVVVDDDERPDAPRRAKRDRAAGRRRRRSPTRGPRICDAHGSAEVLIEAEVALARVGEHGDDVLAGAELACDVERHVHRSAGADADEEPLAVGERALVS